MRNVLDIETTIVEEWVIHKAGQTFVLGERLSICMYALSSAPSSSLKVLIWLDAMVYTIVTGIVVMARFKV
jgi:hypothetical protein